MKDRREINIEVFEDTMKNYKGNPTLRAAVSNSVATRSLRRLTKRWSCRSAPDIRRPLR